VVTIADVPSRRHSPIVARPPCNRLEDVLFENPSCGIALLDEEGRVARSNAVFRSMLDAGPEGTDGMCTGSFVRAEDGDHVDRAIASACAGDLPAAPLVVRYVTSGGTERVVRQWILPLRGSALQQGRVLLVAKDLAEVMVAERRLGDAVRIAHAGIASAALAHDLSGVLVPLRAFVVALEASPFAGDSGSRERGHLDGLREVADYVQGLADAVERSGHDDPGERSSTDIAAWWRRTGEFLRRGLPGSIELRFDLADEVACVAIPAHRLSQLCLNLLANAGRASGARTAEDGSPARIVVRAAPAEVDGGRWVRLSVSDEGIGMDGRAWADDRATHRRGRGRTHRDPVDGGRGHLRRGAPAGRVVTEETRRTVRSRRARTGVRPGMQAQPREAAGADQPPSRVASSARLCTPSFR
jgi:signal transduction histidine kinase